jgi:uncharacterized membrane protein YeaQ/YmgE (transglycosylase-associated protein family)
MTDEGKPLPPDNAEWKRCAEEYRSVVAMIHDTGRLIWVILGTYLVLMGLIARPLLESGMISSVQERIIRGLVGAVVASLCSASFERNYAFYNLRISHARSLEAKLGFRLFTLGQRLGRDRAVAMDDGSIIRIAFPGTLASIQMQTRSMIIGFFLAFVLLLILR